MTGLHAKGGGSFIAVTRQMRPPAVGSQGPGQASAQLDRQPLCANSNVTLGIVHAALAGAFDWVTRPGGCL